ncbi:MAG: hypothetical protein OEY62_00825 [Acidimicrobiia bacterium]|jgi:hypothetical protein|nr:hypothetical protein [Acidimicrobiia bacterium]
MCQSTDERPFLVTIPSRSPDKRCVPDGWTTLQVGRSQAKGPHPSRVGIVCFDPISHDIAVWLSTCTVAAEMRAAGWRWAFEFGGSSVWFRLTADAETQAAA